MRILIGLLLLFVGFTTSVDQHATATVRLNKSFFQLASGKAKSLIDTLVPEIKIPNINSTGTVKFWTRWIKLTHFDFPRTTFSISKDGLTWNTEGGKIEIEMEFVARYEPIPGGPSLTVVGNATTTAEDLRTNLNALIKTVNSRPEIVVNRCSTKVENLDVVFNMKDTISDVVLNIIHSKIADYIQNVISEKACDLIGKLADEGNKFVRAQPEEIHIWRNIYLNYTAAKDPIYHDDYIEAECSFRVAIRDNKTAYPELGGEEDFASAILESMNSMDSKVIGGGHISFTPKIAASSAFYPSDVLPAFRDALLYALAAYGVFSIFQSILQTILLRRGKPPLYATQAKAYENLAVVDQ